MEVMINDVKRRRADRVIATPNRFEVESAEHKLYDQSGELKGEDRVLFIYKGLGGVLVTKEKAKKIKESRKRTISKRNK